MSLNNVNHLILLLPFLSCFPFVSSLSISCQNADSPIFVPLSAEIVIKCSYVDKGYPVAVVRLDGPPGYSKAMYKFRGDQGEVN